MNCAEGLLSAWNLIVAGALRLYIFWRKREHLETHMPRLWDLLTLVYFPAEHMKLYCGLWPRFSLCSFLLFLNQRSEISVAKDVGLLGVHTLIRTGMVEISHIYLSNHVSCSFMSWSKLKVLITVKLSLDLHMEYVWDVYQCGYKQGNLDFMFASLP